MPLLSKQIKPLLCKKLANLLEKEGGIFYQYSWPEFNLTLQIEKVSIEREETNTCFYFIYENKIYKITELV